MISLQDNIQVDVKNAVESAIPDISLNALQDFEDVPIVFSSMIDDEDLFNNVEKNCVLNNVPRLVISESLSVSPAADCSTVDQSSSECVRNSYNDLEDNGTPVQKRKRTRTNSIDQISARKRSRNPAAWLVNIHRERLNAGKEYTTKSGKIKRAKAVQPGCDDTCRKKCSTKLTGDQRQVIFNDFWAIGNRSRQWDYLSRIIQIQKKKTCRDPHLPSRRNNSLKFMFRVDSKIIVVCKKMFKATLDIGEAPINTVTLKMGKGAKVSPDKRGSHRNRSTKMLDATKSRVAEHINLFQRKEAHYVRKDSKREYLCEEIKSVHAMHSLYLEWIKNNYPSEKVVTERQYRDIFNSNFNIGFFIPKKDQCDSCTSWSIASDNEKECLKASNELHVKNKIRSRELKDQDAAEAKVKDNRHIVTACFDLQKVLNVPKIEASSAYYKRKLSMYNFTIYDIGRSDGFCYVWTEDIGNKGSNEIASYLLDFIETMAKKGATDFRFYSDNCAGQNKNRFVFSMFAYAAAKCNVQIVHRFLECGHTQNEGDAMHSLIERTSKNQTIFVPEQWLTIMRMARPKNPYTVIEVNQDMIFNFKLLSEKMNTTINTSGNKVGWSKVREIRTTGANAGFLNYKISYDGIEETINLNHRIGHPLNLLTYKPVKAYTNILGVPQATKKDLISFFDPKKPLIPLNHQQYYNSLPVKPEKVDLTKMKVEKTEKVILKKESIAMEEAEEIEVNEKEKNVIMKVKDTAVRKRKVAKKGKKTQGKPKSQTKKKKNEK